MDNDRFQKEVLTRLDKILALLTVSCRLADGALDKNQAEGYLRQIIGTRQSSDTQEPRPNRINDEMEDNYQAAVQKWKAERSM